MTPEEAIIYQNAVDDAEKLREQIEIMHLRRENELRQMNDLSRENKLLKEKLIGERAMSLHWYQQAHEGEKRDWEEYSGEEQESRLWYAEHLLRAEMLEVFK